jgi:cytochrome b pre-mRNA-processing protein 3
MILPPFRRDPQKRIIGALYGMIVAQARNASFYACYGVPDTVEGRFDLIVLHLVLLLRRLEGEGDSSEAEGDRQQGVDHGLGQKLFDAFCQDLDDNLREMGVGDLAVPKRMRRFGEAFYGRQAAYRAALASGGTQELEKALARNIFEVVGADERAARLARYVRAAESQLSAEEDDALMAGTVTFPNPEAFAHA